ncbi:MAG: transglutaminase family protein [Oleispira sp.]|nr:transglutaminase family protein [Oleispira sp.]MBL4881261.1 transglutaminase family protein [Oleispira sp.]
MKIYLASTEHVDWQQQDVLAKALSLTEGLDSEEAIVKACFEFVRDEIKHSWDYQINPVTCKASEVLMQGTGYCYAKSHLLAALLRANKIPAGLCYQRLTISGDQAPFCLHGLNAVYLKDHGWYRIDPRGNKEGVNAEFCPPKEQLAFPLLTKGEADLPEIWAEPLAVVVDALTQYSDFLEVANNLPDIVLYKTHSLL